VSRIDLHSVIAEVLSTSGPETPDSRILTLVLSASISQTEFRTQIVVDSRRRGVLECDCDPIVRQNSSDVYRRCIRAGALMRGYTGRIAFECDVSSAERSVESATGAYAMRADGTLMSSVRSPEDPLSMLPAVRSGDGGRRLPESR